MENKRLFERFKTSLPTKFAHSAGAGVDAYVKDVSAQGIMFVTEQQLFINDIISLQVEIPDVHEPVHLNGRIVRIDKVEHNVWEVGVDLENINHLKMTQIFSAIYKNKGHS